MGRLLLVRHGETDWHLENRILGRTNTSLNEKGFRQAELIGEWMAGQNLSALYVSPMQRCRETLKPTADRKGMAPVILPDLQEIDFGEWDGRTAADIMAESPELLRNWLLYPSRFRVPGGESLPEVLERVTRGVNSILAAHTPEDDIMLVTHGGPIRLAVCIALGMEMDRMLRLEVDLASITLIKFFGDTIDNRVSVVGLNDTHHLSELACAPGDVLPEMHSHEELKG
jgi:broad specificity phosphatase PhoE